MNANEWLATKLLGLKKNTRGNYWVDKHNIPVYETGLRNIGVVGMLPLFDPPDNIEQAFMCLDQMDRDESGQKESGKCWCWCVFKGNYGEHVGADTRAEAIVNAILQATDYPGE